MSTQLSNKQLALYFGCEAMVLYPWENTERRFPIDEELLFDNILQAKVGKTLRIKPILRPISDFKEMDIVGLAKIVGQEPSLDAEINEEIIQAAKKHGWDCFDADVKLKDTLSVIPYLIEREFDIFNWIEQGLAVDKTKLTSIV